MKTIIFCFTLMFLGCVYGIYSPGIEGMDAVPGRFLFGILALICFFTVCYLASTYFDIYDEYAKYLSKLSVADSNVAVTQTTLNNIKKHISDIQGDQYLGNKLADMDKPITEAFSKLNDAEERIGRYKREKLEILRDIRTLEAKPHTKLVTNIFKDQRARYASLIDSINNEG